MPGMLLIIKQLAVVGVFASCGISVVEIVCVQILFLILDVKISSWAKKMKWSSGGIFRKICFFWSNEKIFICIVGFDPFSTFAERSSRSRD